MSTTQIIQLKSALDGTIVNIDRALLRHSTMLDTMLKDLSSQETPTATSDPIPITQLEGKHLKMLVEWMEHHKDDKEPSVEQENDDEDDHNEEFGGVQKIDIPEWDNTFLNSTGDIDDVKEIMMAANFLDMKVLFDYCAQYFADGINRMKSVEKIREFLKVENDFTPEEEEQLRKENAWCDDL